VDKSEKRRKMGIRRRMNGGGEGYEEKEKQDKKKKKTMYALWRSSVKWKGNISSPCLVRSCAGFRQQDACRLCS